MTILIHRNFSPQWTEWLKNSGLDAIHWSSIGESNASDDEIFAHARNEGMAILVRDSENRNTIRLRFTDKPNADIRQRMGRIVMQRQAEIESGVCLIMEATWHLPVRVE